MALLVQTENVVWCETVVQTVQQREVSYTSINYTGMCVYLHLKMFMCWSSLSAITLPPATGLVETHEVKEIKAHFTSLRSAAVRFSIMNVLSERGLS